MRRALPLGEALLLLGGLALLWQFAFELTGPSVLLPPLGTASALFELLRTAEFWGDIVQTGTAFLAALLIAIGAGLPLGLLLGLHRMSAEVAQPLLLGANSLPKITLYPIVLLVFGIGMPAKIAFGAIHGIVPVAFFTMSACRTIPPILLRSAAALRLSRAQTIRSVLLPAALPEIFTGLRIGFALTLTGTVLGEMFGSQRGLGYLLMTAIGLQNIGIIMAVTLLLVLFAGTVSTLLLAIDRRLHRQGARSA